MLQVAKEQLKVLEKDFEKALLNATRDVAHSQLAMHAKGVELFTAALQALPPPR